MEVVSTSEDRDLPKDIHRRRSPPYPRVTSCPFAETFRIPGSLQSSGAGSALPIPVLLSSSLSKRLYSYPT